ncbi:uncharacterized protein LOC126867837 isoform X2 [Bombus huntii]|uniref:uncharacterized protein LOC126867837 isoform X2 n=1 Tax=Bombus huntii TaxID=85661 RepID=UPI0021AAEEEA|nr:uncharacterized protein LOC126867837 isoform X2 [Bombus huntii]
MNVNYSVGYRSGIGESAETRATTSDVPLRPPHCGFSNVTHTRVVGGRPAKLVHVRKNMFLLEIKNRHTSNDTDGVQKVFGKKLHIRTLEFSILQVETV